MKTNLVLLGTGGDPQIYKGSSCPTSMVLDVDGRPYLIDAGLGVTQQFVKANYSLDELHTVFITHLLSDHVIELCPLLHTTWATSYQRTLRVFGPPGIEDVIEGFYHSLKYDIETRMVEDNKYPIRNIIKTSYLAEGRVLKDDRVEVTAMRVKHPICNHCYALRFQMHDKTVVFSSDTAVFPKLADFAAEADVLVHEVSYSAGLNAKQRIQNPKNDTLDSHTKAEEVGIIANIAGVKHLVLNHIQPRPEGNYSKIRIYDKVRENWKGKLTIGHDLMWINV